MVSRKFKVATIWRQMRGFVIAVTTGTVFVILIPFIILLFFIVTDTWWNIGGKLLFLAAIVGLPLATNILASLVIGLPLTWFLRRIGREYWVIYLAAGAIFGFLIVHTVMMLAFGENTGRFMPVLGALSGGVTGLIWWAARRDAISMDAFFTQPGIDFPDREQPAMQEREPLASDVGDERPED